MIKYGDDRVTNLQFAAFYPRIERRDEQWVDVELRFETKPNTDEVPSDLIELTALVICTRAGAPIQIEAQDAGCDCEYQFTFFEKEQIEAFVRSDEIQEAIRRA
ncbi:hypothetical protein [Cohnella thailandensis]|jgi:hypothetical protein|uniref:Uncharacterized protein n=1 Tax=Cohnella thailandensis TaxID=557557 RepID=A0A841T803_9BACL|nr:hypothetical protein [Cohnella thailandensis]MBB6638378.1 hypothetical protein [Cohnella thailandensis]MBP1977144.1 hypothetical protein [Cohnella thailandensis]